MLLALFLGLLVSADALSGRIIGGSDTTISKHPYQVSIHYNGELHCGGSIISNQWILTAAHCVYGRKPKLLKIRVGSDHSDTSGKLIEDLSSVIYHELYDEDTFDYDIALIKLVTPITFNPTTKAVTLASSTTSVATGSLAVVTGWGKTTESGHNSKKLKELQVPIFDQQACQKIFAYYNTVTSRMLCAGFTSGGKDTCQGDSGGPLVYNGIQIGIVSWGAKCASAGFPGVYTRISAVRSWITKRASI